MVRAVLWQLPPLLGDQGRGGGKVEKGSHISDILLCSVAGEGYIGHGRAQVERFQEWKSGSQTLVGCVTMVKSLPSSPQFPQLSTDGGLPPHVSELQAQGTSGM